MGSCFFEQILYCSLYLYSLTFSLMFRRKIIASILLIGYVAMNIVPAAANNASDVKNWSTENATEASKLIYPEWAEFIALKKLITENFSSKNEESQYTYNCIQDNSLCPTYRYTSVIEKAIKLIVTKTHTGNEDFYKKLFHLFHKNLIW